MIQLYGPNKGIFGYPFKIMNKQQRSMLCKLQDAVNFELQKLRAFEDSEFSIEEIKAEISKTDLKDRFV